MNIRSRLEELADTARRGANKTETAITVLKELAPELKIKQISFTYLGDTGRGRHALAEVTTQDGLFKVDPMISNHCPNAPMVYGPQDKYPLSIIPGTVFRD